MSSEGRPRLFLSYVHSLRGLAILFVVTIHVGEAEDWQTSSSWIERVTCALMGNATVPFMFVSGFLLQYLSERFHYRKYLSGRLKNLIVPYLVVSIPTLVHQFLRHSGVFEGTGACHPIVATLAAYATGTHMSIPLWYVPVIVLFALAAPVFVAMDRRPASYWFIVPTLIVAVVLHRSRGHRCVLQSTLYFLPVYLTGMWSSHYREAVLAWVSRARWWMFGIATALFLVEVLAWGQLGPVYSRHPFSTEGHVMVDLDLPVKLLLTLVLLEWLRRHDTTVRGWLAGLADTSFGIFFLHEYLIQLFRTISIRTHHVFSHPGVAVFLLSVPIVTTASLLAVRVTQWFLGERSRLLIGS